MAEPKTEPALRKNSNGRLTLLLRLLLLVGAILLLNQGAERLFERLELAPYYEKWGGWLLAVTAAAFILLLSLPFVPGMELGLAMMMLFDMEGVLLVYGSTLVALSLSYLAGRLIPLWRLGRLLGWLHLRRAQALVERLERRSGQERMALLLEGSSGRLVPFLVRHRYIAIALVLNMPGNSFIGGGGGIGLLAGTSGIFSYPRYLALVAVAVLPLPLLFLAGYYWG